MYKITRKSVFLYKNLAIIIGKKTRQNQRNLFDPQLADIIDMNHELALLTHAIQWDTIEKSLAKYYSNVGNRLCPSGLWWVVCF